MVFSTLPRAQVPSFPQHGFPVSQSRHALSKAGWLSAEGPEKDSGMWLQSLRPQYHALIPLGLPGLASFQLIHGATFE